MCLSKRLPPQSRKTKHSPCRSPGRDTHHSNALDALPACAYISLEYESAQKPQAVEKTPAQDNLRLLRGHCLRANAVIPTRAWVAGRTGYSRPRARFGCRGRVATVELLLFQLPGRQAGQNQKSLSILYCHFFRRRRSLVSCQCLTWSNVSNRGNSWSSTQSLFVP